MRRLLPMAVVFVLLATSAAFAEDVYVTVNGKKFHKEACRLIKTKNPSKIDKEAALKKGLEPCKVCYKENNNKKTELK